MRRKQPEAPDCDAAVLRLRKMIDGRTGHSMMRVIAERLNIKRQAPYGWRRVPPEHVLTVAELSGMTTTQLRSDIYPAALLAKAVGKL